MSTCVITTKVFPFTIEYFAAVYAKEELLRLLGKETKIILNSQIDFVIPNEILNSLPKSTDTLLENSNEVIEIKKVKEIKAWVRLIVRKLKEIKAWVRLIARKVK